MDQLSSLLNLDGKKSFKKDIHSEEINVEVYLVRSIKWLGLFSLALAVIAQIMNEVSGTDMKCFPDKTAGFGKDWMKEQMNLSKAFGEYVDVHCATAMVDYGPLIPNVTNDQMAKYTHDDVNSLAKGTLHLPYRRCIEKHDDLAYCVCEAKWKDDDKPLPYTCNKTAKPPLKSAIQKLNNNEVKYREEMFHHYFAWFLLMQAIAILTPQHIWNTAFSENILRKLLKIHECTQASKDDLERVGGELVDELRSIQTPTMTVVFLIKQVYYFAGGLFGYHLLNVWVGYGIQENEVTRCLMEEYTFVICASPANGFIWFVYVIDLVVIWVIVISAFCNIIAISGKRLTKAHISKEFLKKLLDKLFEDSPRLLEDMKSFQNQPCSDYPFFSRLVQENKNIFGDIYISLISRNEIASVDAEELKEEIGEELVRQTVMAWRANIQHRATTTVTEE